MLQGFNVTRFQSFMVTKFHGFKVSWLQSFMVTKVHGSKFHGSKVSRFQSFKVLLDKIDIMTVKRFEELEIWQKARELCKKIRLVADSTSLSKDFGLRNQVLDSSGSVMDNIAEGFERDGKKEFLNFFTILKDLWEKQGLRFTVFTIQVTLLKKNTRNYLKIALICQDR
jgi:hypothetical protein